MGLITFILWGSGSSGKMCKELISHRVQKLKSVPKVILPLTERYTTQGKIALRNESGRPMKVKVVGEVSEK